MPPTETGQRHTVKRYESEKAGAIVLAAADAEQLRVVAELVEALTNKV